MMESSDKNVAYALRAIQQPPLRETEEFRQWLSVPENKALFLDLMATKEAVMRESLHRKSKVRRTNLRRMWIAATVAAAVWALALLIPALSPSTDVATEQPIRFFTAIADEPHVVLQMDGHQDQPLTDSVLDVKECPIDVPDAPCCQTLTTPRGKNFLLILSDGTKVWINAESSLRYPVEFTGKERRVELKGEACFEVAKNEECPFIVSADGMDTRVLGTKFNVRSYTPEDRHVTLVQGKVQVTNRETQTSVVLQPGQDLTYTETGEESISSVNIATYTAWTEGMFYFEDAPLGDIMHSLGRWYNVNIDFEQADLHDIHLNFWADKQARLEEVLELLNALEKVRVGYQEGTITIRHI